MNWLKHIITDADNQTVDIARVLWIVGVLVFLGLTSYEGCKSGHFNMGDFALAYSGLLTAGAAGVKIKASTEPLSHAG
jgi:ABC-type uncharacterized transport system permease subunit